MIHIFGDSHSSIYKYIPEITVHNVGPVTMHRVGRDGVLSAARRCGPQTEVGQEHERALGVQLCAAPDRNGSAFQKHGIKNGDFVVFVFGEIDVRNHIGKQIDLGRDEDEVVKSLAENYLQSIHEEASAFDSVTCAIRFVTPVSEKTRDPIRHPAYGTKEYRVQLVNKLNGLLRDESPRYGVVYIDGYDEFVAENGFVSPVYCSDGIHLNKKALPLLLEQLHSGTSQEEK